MKPQSQRSLVPLRRPGPRGVVAVALTFGIWASSLVCADEVLAAQGDPPLGDWDRAGNETGEAPPPPDGPPPPPPNGEAWKPRSVEDDPPKPTRKRLSIDAQRRALAASRARVEERNYGNKVVFGVGGVYRIMPSDLEIGAMPGNTAPPSAESSFGTSVRLGYNPVDVLTLSAEVVWQPTRLKGLSDPATFLGLRGVAQAFIPFGTVRPFAQLFAGGEWLSKAVGPVGSDIDASLGGGVGVQVELSNLVGLRVDGKVVATDGPGNRFARIWEFGAGLTVRFMPVP